MASCHVLALFTTPIHSSIKDSSSHLMEVMDVAVEVINFIRSRAKNQRLFELLAQEMGAQHVGLLFCAKVRWLWRDRCLSRLHELKNAVTIFLRENKNNLCIQFHNKEFAFTLA